MGRAAPVAPTGAHSSRTLDHSTNIDEGTRVATASRGKHKQRRRWRGVLAGVLAALVLIVAAVPAALVLVPRADTPGTSDALITLGPPFDGRLAMADQLMREGRARELLVFTYDEQHERDTVTLCNEPQPYPVHCITPEPYTTRGEAQAIGRLAQVNGWQSVQVLTFAPHVNRARVLVDRCTDATVHVLETPDFYGPYEQLHHAGGWLKMVTYWDC